MFYLSLGFSEVLVWYWYSMGGLSGSQINSRFQILGKVGLVFYIGLWIRLLHVENFYLGWVWFPWEGCCMLKVVSVSLRLSGLSGMVRNDFEDEIKFRWGRVVTLSFELLHYSGL